MIEWKNENLDFFIDSVLRAGGSALKHYSMASSLSAMRTAMLNAAMNIESAVSEQCAEKIESLSAERAELAQKVAALTLQRDQFQHTAENATRECSRLSSEVVSKLIAERDALKARVAELERDAGRYRWLRDDMDGNAQEEFIRLIAGSVLARDEFDAAIDAAREVKLDGTKEK